MKHSKMADRETRGPLAGTSSAVHGGSPGSMGCNGCTDCCHLPEISVTDEEAVRLRQRYEDISDPMGDLVILPDDQHEGWHIMRGPCVFRRLDTSLATGGCRVYEDRPSGCAIFTCAFLLEQRRRVL